MTEMKQLSGGTISSIIFKYFKRQEAKDLISRYLCDYIESHVSERQTPD